MKLPFIAALAAFALPVVGHAGPQIKGTWEATFKVSAYNAVSESHDIFPGAATLVITEQDGDVFAGYMAYANDLETIFPLNGTIKGLRVRATVDGGVIEGTLSKFAGGLYRKLTFTSVAPLGSRDVQTALAGTAVRQ